MKKNNKLSAKKGRVLPEITKSYKFGFEQGYEKAIQEEIYFLESKFQGLRGVSPYWDRIQERLELLKLELEK